MDVTDSQDQAEFSRHPPGILPVGLKIVEAELAGGDRRVLRKSIEVPKQRVGKGIARGIGAVCCPGGWTEIDGAVVSGARVLGFAVPHELRSELERMIVFRPGDVVHRIYVGYGGCEVVRSWTVHRSRARGGEGRHTCKSDRWKAICKLPRRIPEWRGKTQTLGAFFSPSLPCPGSS